MERKRAKSSVKNVIKIFPSKPPDLLTLFQKNYLEPKIRQTLKILKRDRVLSLPKLSKMNNMLHNNNQSFTNLYRRRSLLNTSQTLLYPKQRDRRFMAEELDKIIAQCNEDSLNNSEINSQINKTENELKDVFGALNKIDELGHRPKKKFKAVNKKLGMIHKNSIKGIIKNMKRMFIRTRAL